MAELTERQIKEQDIDWYCLVNGRPAHIASMGGMIPKKYRDRAVLRLQQHAVALMDPFSEVRLNDAVILTQVAKGYEYLQDAMIRDAIIEANKSNPGFVYLKDYELAIRLFASTFVEKARRGFRSFARKENVNGNEYVLIAEPTIPVKNDLGGLGLEELKCEVRNEGGTFVF